MWSASRRSFVTPCCDLSWSRLPLSSLPPWTSQHAQACLVEVSCCWSIGAGNGGWTIVWIGRKCALRWLCRVCIQQVHPVCKAFVLTLDTICRFVCGLECTRACHVKISTCSVEGGGGDLQQFSACARGQKTNAMVILIRMRPKRSSI